MMGDFAGPLDFGTCECGHAYLDHDDDHPAFSKCLAKDCGCADYGDADLDSDWVPGLDD